MCGAMAQIDTLVDIVPKAQLILIEDAAQAAGATLSRRTLGTFGKMGCFSFDYVKTITCGEGGAIITDDRAGLRLAQAFTDHGHDHLGADRGADQHPHIGTTQTQRTHAAVGVAQLARLDHILECNAAQSHPQRAGLRDFAVCSFGRCPILPVIRLPF